MNRATDRVLNMNRFNGNIFYKSSCKAIKIAVVMEALNQLLQWMDFFFSPVKSAEGRQNAEVTSGPIIARC